MCFRRDLVDIEVAGSLLLHHQIGPERFTLGLGLLGQCEGVKGFFERLRRMYLVSDDAMKDLDVTMGLRLPERRNYADD